MRRKRAVRGLWGFFGWWEEVETWFGDKKVIVVFKRSGDS